MPALPLPKIWGEGYPVITDLNWAAAVFVALAAQRYGFTGAQSAG